jgi:hypothetical protein
MARASRISSAGAADREPREDQPGRRIARLHRLAGLAVDPRTIDQQFVRLAEKRLRLGRDGVAVEGCGIGDHTSTLRQS